MSYADLSDEEQIETLGRAVAALLGPRPTPRDRLALSMAMRELGEAIEEEVRESRPVRLVSAA